MTSFVITKEYKRFVEFCNSCRQEQYIGLCHGPAGVGKSMSAEHFAQWDKIGNKIQNYVKDRYSGSLPIIPELKKLDTIIYTPEVHNTPTRVKSELFDLIFSFNDLKEKAIHKEKEFTYRNYVKILIIDEADRLQPKSLEQVRDMYDRMTPLYYNKGKNKIAVILIGMPGIEKRLIRFPQLYSRIGFIHIFQPLSKEEISFIIQKHCKTLKIKINKDDFTDHEAISSMSRITQGNFRLIDRLLKQAVRIMKLNRQSYISKEIIETARECLVIGNI